MQPIAAAVALAALTAPAHAGEWIVYASHPDNLAHIIALAAPGDVLRIHPGEYSPIVVDKPLTLLAEVPDLMPFIRSYELGAVVEGTITAHVPPITFAGSGGRVVLHGIETGDDVDGYDQPWITCPPALTGSGFDEVLILDSVIRAPQWSFGYGSYPGASAIEGPIGALVTVSGSELIASDNRAWGDFYSFPDSSAAEGIDGAETVIVLDSTVEAGDKRPFDVSKAPTCQAQQQYAQSAGHGAAAVAADQLFVADSTLTGGAVPIWSSSGSCPISEQSGDDFSGHLKVDLPAGLSSTGSPALGELFQLTADVGSSPGLLIVGSTLVEPADLGALGWLLIDPAAPGFALQALAPGTTTLDWLVPWTPALVGTTLAAQAYRSDAGLTRPVTIQVTVL